MFEMNFRVAEPEYFLSSNKVRVGQWTFFFHATPHVLAKRYCTVCLS